MNGTDFWKAFAMPLGLMVLFVIAFIAVYGINKDLTKAPTIELVSSDTIVTDQAEVPITGVVKNTSKLVVGGKETSVGTDGAFSAIVPVNLGDNTVVVVAGNKTQAKATVRVTREEVEKAITSTTTTAVSTDLAPSGPVESLLGSLGMAAILVSLLVYRRSTRGNALQNA